MLTILICEAISMYWADFCVSLAIIDRKFIFVDLTEIS